MASGICRGSWADPFKLRTTSSVSRQVHPHGCGRRSGTPSYAPTITSFPSAVDRSHWRRGDGTRGVRTARQPSAQRRARSTHVDERRPPRCRAAPSLVQAHLLDASPRATSGLWRLKMPWHTTRRGRPTRSWLQPCYHTLPSNEPSHLERNHLAHTPVIWTPSCNTRCRRTALSRAYEPRAPHRLCVRASRRRSENLPYTCLRTCRA